VRGGVLGAHTQDDPFFLARNFLERNGHLAISLGRVVFAERVAFPVFRHQDPTQVRMSRELYPKEIENLALEGIGARINGNQRVHTRILSAGAHLESKAFRVLQREQVINNLKARFVRVDVHGGDVGEESVGEAGFVPQELARPDQHIGPDVDRDLTSKLPHLFHRLGSKFSKLLKSEV